MRRLLAALALLGAAAIAGCSSGPYCSDFVDMTGRQVAFCDNPRADPVCDLPDDEARFEETSAGFMLVGGEFARCSSEGTVECPIGTVGDPYCIVDPEL